MSDQITSFSDFAIEPALLESILAIGFDTPTEIQKQAIPLILEGQDLIGMAQTGTGKTAAFVIPLLNKIMLAGASKGIQAMVITPTRELAVQIDQTIDGLSYFTGVTSVAVYGGSDKQAFEQQMAAIKRGADILVATPGRLQQHLNLFLPEFVNVKTLVLDEADKMLDMGFAPDILNIVKDLPAKRQTLMFSATMPAKIHDFARKILRPEAATIRLQLSKPAEGIDQRIYIVYDKQKVPLLLHIFEQEEVENLILFTSSKAKADEIYGLLKRKKLDVEVFHSDKSQEERMDLMRRFKNKEVRILVATDILSRGIDIDNLSHVFNFDIPHDAEDYIHRIGRTARSGKTGVAITLVGEREQYKLGQIEKLIGRELPKTEVPSFLGETPPYPMKRLQRHHAPPQDGNRKPFFNKNKRNDSPKNQGNPQRQNRKPKPPLKQPPQQ